MRILNLFCWRSNVNLGVPPPRGGEQREQSLYVSGMPKPNLIARPREHTEE